MNTATVTDSGVRNHERLPGLPVAYWCTECGAKVHDPDKHNAWHGRFDEAEPTR